MAPLQPSSSPVTWLAFAAGCLVGAIVGAVAALLFFASQVHKGRW